VGEKVLYLPRHLQPTYSTRLLDPDEAPGAEEGEVAYINERFVHVQFLTGDGTPKINTQACEPGDLWFKI
jgi:hypothetical protein